MLLYRQSMLSVWSQVQFLHGFIFLPHLAIFPKTFPTKQLSFTGPKLNCTLHNLSPQWCNLVSWNYAFTIPQGSCTMQFCSSVASLHPQNFAAVPPSLTWTSQFAIPGLKLLPLPFGTPQSTENPTSLGLNCAKVSPNVLSQPELTDLINYADPFFGSLCCQFSLPLKTAQICVPGSHPTLAMDCLNCAILTPSGHCAIFPSSEGCAQKFLNQAWAALCAVLVLNLSPCHLELRNAQSLDPLSQLVTCPELSSWITMHHLKLRSFQIDVALSWVTCRNWYTVKSWWDDEGGGNMPKYLLVVGQTKEPINSKQKEHMYTTTSQDQRSLKTLHHQAMWRRRESISKNTYITLQQQQLDIATSSS